MSMINNMNIVHILLFKNFNMNCFHRNNLSQSWQLLCTTRRPARSDPTFVETDPGRIESPVPVCARVEIRTVIDFPEIRSGLPGVTGNCFYEEL